MSAFPIHDRPLRDLPPEPPRVIGTLRIPAQLIDRYLYATATAPKSAAFSPFTLTLTDVWITATSVKGESDGSLAIEVEVTAATCAAEAVT